MFGSRGLRILIVLIGIFVALGVVEAGISHVTSPWSHGRSALVGHWRGEMTVAPGDTRQVVLYLKKYRTFREILFKGTGGTRGSGPGPDLAVAAKACGPKGATRYHGHGNVADRQGERFTFGLAPDSNQLGTHPSTVEGIHDEDRLQLTVRLQTVGPASVTGEASISARPNESHEVGTVRVQLLRSTEQAFDDAC